jgi:hypothetical protein
MGFVSLMTENHPEILTGDQIKILAIRKEGKVLGTYFADASTVS